MAALGVNLTSMGRSPRKLGFFLALIATIVAASCGGGDATGGGSGSGSDGGGSGSSGGSGGSGGSGASGGSSGTGGDGASTEGGGDDGSGGSCLGSAALQALGTNRLLVGASMADSTAVEAPFDLRYNYISGGFFDGTSPCTSCATGCTASGKS